MKLKQDANKLESMNKEMYTNITKIESTYVKKVTTWSRIITLANYTNNIITKLSVIISMNI